MSCSGREEPGPNQVFCHFCGHIFSMSRNDFESELMISYNDATEAASPENKYAVVTRFFCPTWRNADRLVKRFEARMNKAIEKEMRRLYSESMVEMDVKSQQARSCGDWKTAGPLIDTLHKMRAQLDSDKLRSLRRRLQNGIDYMFDEICVHSDVSCHELFLTPDKYKRLDPDWHDETLFPPSWHDEALYLDV